MREDFSGSRAMGNRELERTSLLEVRDPCSAENGF